MNHAAAMPPQHARNMPDAPAVESFVLRVHCDTEPALVGHLRCHADSTDAEGFVTRWHKRSACDVYELPHDPEHLRVQRPGSHEARRLPRSAVGSLTVDRTTWGLDLPDPTPVRHRPNAAPLFALGRRPRTNDIAQGMLGSCQLLAAAAQMTRRYPHALPARLRATPADVRLRCHPEAHVSYATADFGREEMQAGDPVILCMSRSTLVYADTPAHDPSPYGACGTGPQFPAWPAFLEKGFAATRGRRYYNPSSLAMTWLTGCPTVLRAANARDPDTLFDDMLERHQANECLTVDVRQRPEAVYPHAYEVLDVDSATRTLSLRCPASTAPEGPHALTVSVDALGTTVESCIYTVGAAAHLQGLR